MRTPSLLALASLAVSSVFFAGCTNGGPGPSETPTYTEDVQPILAKACTSCHSTGNIAPFSLEGYTPVKSTIDAIVEETTSRRMPPWGALETAECDPIAPFKDDPRLSDDEIAVLQAWRDAGMPEGPPKDPPTGGGASGFELDTVDLELKPSVGFAASGDTDQFVCFQLDPNFVTDTFVDGWNVVAGNPKVVHHALVFLDQNAESDALVDADGKYDCFGGPGLGGVNLIGAWAPGTPAFTMDGSQVAVKIPAGAKLVMQIHYHPGGQAAEPDVTAFQMRFTPTEPPYQMQMILLGNFGGPMPEGGLLPGPDDAAGVEFRIPANVANHTETMEYLVDSSIPAVPLYGAGTHMHYVGRDMKFSVVRGGTGQEECLVQTPSWDFNWQRAYMYDRPFDQLPTISGGDTLRMRCTYDNTLQNPFVSDALSSMGMTTPMDVYLGEETLDEMCLAVFPIVVSSLL